MREYIELLADLVDNQEEIKPLIQKGISLLKSYAPELKEVLDSVIDYTIERRIKSVHLFEKAGFTREEAIILSMDNNTSIGNAFKQF